MTPPPVNAAWTLFLDRDGVLNRKIENGYVLNPAMLEVLNGAARAVASLASRMGRIVIVTNQRGIARGLMGLAELEDVHAQLRDAIAKAGGRIDGIFTCPHEKRSGCGCRKPDIGLALQAKQRFPEIDFSRSILAGDSDSDIQFGRTLGMYTVRIGPCDGDIAADLVCADLPELCDFLNEALSGFPR